MDSNMEISNNESAASGSFTFAPKNRENHQKSRFFVQNLDFRHPQTSMDDKAVNGFGFSVV